MYKEKAIQEVKENIKIMQAFIDGKIIEVLDTELDIWLEIDNPIFDFIHNRVLN